MKLVAIFSVVLGAMSFAVEKTTLEFALQGVTFVNHKEVKLNIVKLNKTLKEAGLDGLPEKISVSKNAKPYWKILMSRIEAANKVLPTELLFSINSGYFYEYPPICYRGPVTGVVAVLDGMMDNFLTSEQGMMAIRYGKTKVIRAEEFRTRKALEERYEGESNAQIDAWFDYDQSSKAVLVMSDLGPQGDGTELYTTYIKPCKVLLTLAMMPVLTPDYVFAEKRQPNSPSLSAYAAQGSKVVKAIADDLDALVGDTVDEGSWDADIIRDRKGSPTKMKCTTKTSPKGTVYTCDITFLLTPYDREEIDSDPWEATCTKVRYVVREVKEKLVLSRDEKSVQVCLETLNESPF